MGTVRQGQGVSPSVARSRQRTARPVDCRLQLILIGDRGVGKTTLLERFTGGAFSENCKSTVGVDFKIRTLDVGDKKIRLQIWDTAGQERFNSITSAYYRNAKGILIVYDLTKRETFEDLGKWMKMVDKYASEDADLLLVGNKLDREMAREVRRDEGEKFARQYCGMRFCESSAKDNSNVDDLFHRLVEDVVKKMPLSPAFPHELSTSSFSLQQDRPAFPEHPSNPPARRCC